MSQFDSSKETDVQTIIKKRKRKEERNMVQQTGSIKISIAESHLVSGSPLFHFQL